MKMLRNEKGIALAMVLVLSVVIVAVMAGLLYMIISGTQISGIQKRYNNALEAGKGGADIAYDIIAARSFATVADLDEINPELKITDACLTAKLNKSTSATNWASCGVYSDTTTMSIDPDNPSTYDFQFEFGGKTYLGVNLFPEYTVYAKIANTVEGNSGGDEGLLGKGVIASGTGEVTVVSRPYLYTIEIEAENAANPQERAKLSVLYQY
jgi:hypothetical protein